MEADAVQPINPFETNNTARRRRATLPGCSDGRGSARGRLAASPARGNHTSALKPGQLKPAKVAAEKRIGPTEERLAKGDLVHGAMHRSVPPIERLKDKFDANPRVRDAMFAAVGKLKRHFDGCLIGIKAQDLDRVFGRPGELAGEEGWVHHFDQFQQACRIMGWYESAAHRGAGRLVVAMVCYEMTLVDAARLYVGRGDTAAITGAALDRLKEGLFRLAAYWRCG